MISLIIYLIKFSISLSFVYAFYVVLLKRLTFYNWNRLFLLSYSIACFFIPFINLDQWLHLPENSNNMLQAIPPFNKLMPAATPHISYQIVIIFFVSGCAVVLLKLIMQFLSLRRINKNAVLLHHSNNIRIYSTDAGGSFTIGNNIYLDIAAHHSHKEIEKVLQHEMIHVKQKHWIDLLIGEMLCIVNWFNPSAWMMRASIRQNLEYIADRQVLQKGYDVKEYQYLLLKISASQHAGIAAHFSLSGLKNRIYMINKIKSARVHLSKFVLIFPLLLLLLFAFRTVNHSPVYTIGVFTDTIPSDSAKNNLLITTRDSLFIGVKEDSKKYKKPPKPPVPPIPPVQVKAPPPPPALPAKSAEPAEPAAPAPPPPIKEKNK
jgi:beta-lactamase regulating signal transducer with metallopeptidase domain